MNYIFELSKEQFQCVNSLLPVSEGYIEPKAVIERNNPGWVFVDSMSDPHAALIWSQGNEGFYIFGNQIDSYAKDLNHFIDIYIKPKLVNRGIKYFQISSVPPATDSELQAIFKSRKLNSWEQSVYLYRKNNMISETIPDVGCLCDINDIIKKYTIKNMDFVEEKILNYWDSIDVFLAKGNGYCVLVDNTVASLSLTGWIAENTHEISIETVEQYRCRGFAKICSAALINKYLEQGCFPYWECETNNTASVKLAEKLGFSKLHFYTCYGFRIAK